MISCGKTRGRRREIVTTVSSSPPLTLIELDLFAALSLPSPSPHATPNCSMGGDRNKNSQVLPTTGLTALENASPEAESLFVVRVYKQPKQASQDVSPSDWLEGGVAQPTSPALRDHHAAHVALAHFGPYQDHRRPPRPCHHCHAGETFLPSTTCWCLPQTPVKLPPNSPPKDRSPWQC
ncbi:hypothetical protein EV356DRAFT_169495 [Viridothelium virens]|uniref:Uncharacterized protein n=1 Tax=Viridothelium virens TaxID=1048519 RepID=A0A6A6HP88_VIRVR|nr:hypothetical protein EV356DRAFT_169495 [Viridothelium virens]